MLPLIAGAMILGVGTYLLDKASSDNVRAREKYDNIYDEQEAWIKHKIKHAKKKDALDKSFKMKKAKKKVADSIYTERKRVNSDMAHIHGDLRGFKEQLDTLFKYKKHTNVRSEKQRFQKEINLVLLARKEIFAIKDSILVQQKELSERLKVANNETRMVQDEINCILNR
jgi:hypothetical protein